LRFAGILQNARYRNRYRLLIQQFSIAIAMPIPNAFGNHSIFEAVPHAPVAHPVTHENAATNFRARIITNLICDNSCPEIRGVASRFSEQPIAHSIVVK
jgi:hypothetical protein